MTDEAAIAAALRKRLDDWLESTSEVYARSSKEAWRSGLVGYLLRGPGALLPLLTEERPEKDWGVEQHPEVDAQFRADMEAINRTERLSP